MKQIMRPKPLSLICFWAGLACIALRQWLMITGINDRGLVEHSHPGNYLSWVLAALIGALLLAALFSRTAVRLRPRKGAAVGLVLGCLGFLAAGCSLLIFRSHQLFVPAAVAAALSGLCSIWMLICMARGKRVHALFYVPGILFFLLFLVCRYQIWNSEPEPQKCFFHITALAGLGITAYLRGALAISRKNWKGYLAVSRWAAFACLAAIPGCVDALPLALWAAATLLDGCMPRKGR